MAVILLCWNAAIVDTTGPGCSNVGLVDRGAKRRGLGTTKTAKQLSKQGTRQIEFSDAFKTKIGSCPVPASKRFWAACGYRRIFKFQTFARF